MELQFRLDGDEEKIFKSLPVPVKTERKLRLVVLGASRTGKTQLVTQFMGKPFSDVYIPTIEDFHRKIYTIRGRTYLLDILETSGTNINPLTQKITLMSGDVFLIVYAVTNKASLDYAKEMLAMVQEAKRSLIADVQHNNAHSWNWGRKQKHAATSFPIILAGNKIDIGEERVVFHEDVQRWLEDNIDLASRRHCENVEVSAKDPSSTQQLFERLFLLSHLPLEMSPYLHRRVSQESFVENSKSLHHKSNLFSRIHNENEANRKEKKHVTKVMTRLPEFASSTGSSTSDDSDSADCDIITHSYSSVEAIAAICAKPRRPSAATEVSLLFDKTKNSCHMTYWGTTGECDHSSVTTHNVKGNSPIKRIKHKLSRVTSSHI